jgi:hypothetical protein
VAPVSRLPALLTVLATLGYLLHLLDETRFGLGIEPGFVVPTLTSLAFALLGFALRLRYLALLSACLGGVLVAYLGGLGHWLPDPVGILFPIGLFDGPGGWLLGINSVGGLALAVVSAGALWSTVSAAKTG